MYFSVNTTHKILYEIGMEVWKIVFHFILEIFRSIPFWHLPYSIAKFPFHPIPFSIPFHTMPWLLILCNYYCNIYSYGCSQVENPEAPDFEKMLRLPAPFQHFRFRVRFRFQPLSSKCFRFHKKFTAFTASASSFRYNIPGLKFEIYYRNDLLLVTD